ncbi:hypothetical protein GGX14DRAFT_382297, partial [Mycena pura]
MVHIFIATAGNAVLTEDDRDNIRAIKLYIDGNLGREKFDLFRKAVSHKMSIDSAWKITRRLGVLSGIEPLWIDCCINSCMAFTGDDADSTSCHYCSERRFKQNGKPRRRFCYIPIIPRLQGFFLDPQKVKQLLYRHEYIPVDGAINDVFDGALYKELRQQRVIVDGIELGHCYFSGKYDIALGFCCDAYLLF